MTKITKGLAKFNTGDGVYHRTGDDSGVVTAVIFLDTGIMYRVTWPGRVSEEHFEVELTADKPIIGVTLNKDRDDD